MPDLSTEYLGLKIKNPLIISSCGLTSEVEKIQQLEQKGAGAVVLKSIFEEEIKENAKSIIKSGGGFNNYWDAENYINQYVQMENLEKYKNLISECKKNTSFPIIASINCSTAKGWANYAKAIELAGADALELNIFIMPTDYSLSSEKVEKMYFNIIKEVRKRMSIPIALKIGFHFSGMAKMIINLSETGIAGIALFNKFFNPDIDIDKMEFTSGKVFTVPEDIALTLRWIGILSGKIKCDIAASGGVHDGKSMIKTLLAGAKVTYAVTTIYNNGLEYIPVMLKELEDWMAANNFNSLEDFRGKLSQDNITNPILYERAQFMKYFSGYK